MTIYVKWRNFQAEKISHGPIFYCKFKNFVKINPREKFQHKAFAKINGFYHSQKLIHAKTNPPR